MANHISEAADLLLEQAKLQLDQQNTDLSSLRVRAVALLSVASLVAGLFGPHLPGKTASTWVLIVVSVTLVLFACNVILALLIAAPKKRWLFTFRLDQMFDRIDDGTLIPVDVTYNLARWAEEARGWNRSKLNRLYLLFAWMCILTGLQVIAWVVAVL
jgi:hypothetical protein